MIYVLWMTHRHEDDEFMFAFDNKAAAEEYKASMLTNLSEINQYRLDKGYIGYEITEVAIYSNAADVKS